MTFDDEVYRFGRVPLMEDHLAPCEAAPSHPGPQRAASGIVECCEHPAIHGPGLSHLGRRILNAASGPKGQLARIARRTAAPAGRLTAVFTARRAST